MPENDKKCVIQAKKYKGDTCVVSARLNLELVEKLDDLANKTGRNRNDIITLLLEYAIENVEIEK